jgi:hypothetical protein
MVGKSFYQPAAVRATAAATSDGIFLTTDFTDEHG